MKGLPFSVVLVLLPLIGVGEDPFFHRPTFSAGLPAGLELRARFNAALDFPARVDLSGFLPAKSLGTKAWAGALLRVGVLSIPSGQRVDAGALTALDWSFFRMQTGFDVDMRGWRAETGLILYPGAWFLALKGTFQVQDERQQIYPMGALGVRLGPFFRAQILGRFFDEVLFISAGAYLSLKHLDFVLEWDPGHAAMRVGFAVKLSTLRLGWRTEFQAALGETQEAKLAWAPGGGI